MIISSHNPMVQELQDAGVIPENCTSWEIKCSVGEPVTVKCEAFVTADQFRLIADALKRNSLQVDAEYVLRPMDPRIGGSVTVNSADIGGLFAEIQKCCAGK